jgi:subtilisin family serine protease
MSTRRVAASLATATALIACLLPAPAALAEGAVDPFLDQAWQLDGDGPMGIASAWQRTTGGDVVVAVLDSGADLEHPDLAPNLWTNTGEIPGNGIDDDHDGVVDDVHGADLVNRDGDPSDDNGHGTHVAGIIGARGGNEVGSAGIAWQVRLMPVKVLDDQATGTAETVAKGMQYAVSHGARIINVSLAGPRPSSALRDAIDAARRAGVLVVAAAGNTGRDLATVPSYPASLRAANVLGVAATTRDGSLLGVSGWGTGVQLAAPGEDILSTALGGGYELRSGTSEAAPMAAGAAALIASVDPAIDFRGLEAALLGGARPTSLPGAERQLDVGGALQAQAEGTLVVPSLVGPLTPATAERGVGRKTRVRLRAALTRPRYGNRAAFRTRVPGLTARRAVEPRSRWGS